MVGTRLRITIFYETTIAKVLVAISIDIYCSVVAVHEYIDLLSIFEMLINTTSVILARTQKNNNNKYLSSLKMFVLRRKMVHA